MKTRLITGSILAAILVPLLFIPTHFFAMAVSVFVIIGSYEFYKMVSQESYNSLGLLFFLIGVLSVYSIGVLFIYTTIQFETLMAIIMGVLLLYLSLRVFMPSLDWAALFQGVFYLGLPFSALVFVHNEGIGMLLYLLLIAMLSDVFAYFSGMLFGKHKLAPRISPKKTIEGMIGGTVMAVLIASILAVTQSLFFESHSFFYVVLVVGVGIMISLLAQLGDLVASSFKRQYDIKDFSNLFPGHGGVLDRFDSTLFAATVLSIVLLVIAVI